MVDATFAEEVMNICIYRHHRVNRKKKTMSVAVLDAGQMNNHTTDFSITFVEKCFANDSIGFKHLFSFGMNT